MSDRNTTIRTVHDLGLAAWFGGSLAGAVAVNGAAADVPDAGWAPVNAAAIGAHLLGGAGRLRANRERVVGQCGVSRNDGRQAHADCSRVRSHRLQRCAGEEALRTRLRVRSNSLVYASG